MTASPRLWRGSLVYAAPPTAWIVHLLLSYALVPPACSSSTVPLHVGTAVLAGVAALAAVRGRRWAQPGRTVAISLGALFLLAILLQGAANAVVDPCA